MVAALDAIVLALAPAFAAGFAIQKLLEVFDAVFSWSSDWIAKLLDERLQEASDDKKLSTKAINGLRGFVLIKPFTGYINSREITKAQSNPPANGDVSQKAGTGKLEAGKNLEEAGQEVQTEEGTEKKIEGKKKEFVTSIKALLTGIAAIGIASWIVSNSSISVIEPLINMMNNNTTMSMNLATNASINATAGANKLFYVSPSVDYWITILFIAAGTDGVNSILKYLGYAKEKKETESGDAE